MTPLPLLRASSARDCPRKAVLEATVEADRDRTDREDRILFRGKRLGRDYADWLKAEWGPYTVRREVKVEWAHGIGHIDIFLRPTRTAIEVLSSAWATGPVVESKLMQLVLYMEHFPRALNGCLVVLNPSDFTEERWPVVRDTDTYRSLADEVHRKIAQLDRWRETGQLPDRVCAKPSEATGHFCRHAETCFAGWEPPVVDLVNDPEAITLAETLAFWKGKEHETQQELSVREAERKLAEAKLADHPAVDGVTGDIPIGPYVVKRTFTRRRPTLDVKKAELAGALNHELLSEFMKPGAAYWTTAIGLADGGPEEDDL